MRETKKETYITYTIWDGNVQAEKWVTTSVDDLIANPHRVNLEFVGLHFINSLRISKGLKPLTHYPVKEKKE